MSDPRTIEPLEHRRLRLHAFSTGLGVLGGLAATLTGAYGWGIAVGPVTGFLLAPVLTAWLIAKPLAAAVPVTLGACIVVCLAAGFLPHPLLSWLGAAAGTLAMTRVLTTSMPDVWPPGPLQCGGCGYDLRGVPGVHCPECGLNASLLPCLNCGYNMKGLPSATCPECGHHDRELAMILAVREAQDRAIRERRTGPADAASDAARS